MYFISKNASFASVDAKCFGAVSQSAADISELALELGAFGQSSKLALLHPRAEGRLRKVEHLEALGLRQADLKGEWALWDESVGIREGVSLTRLAAAPVFWGMNLKNFDDWAAPKSLKSVTIVVDSFIKASRAAAAGIPASNLKVIARPVGWEFLRNRPVLNPDGKILLVATDDLELATIGSLYRALQAGSPSDRGVRVVIFNRSDAFRDLGEAEALATRMFGGDFGLVSTPENWRLELEQAAMAVFAGSHSIEFSSAVLEAAAQVPLVAPDIDILRATQLQFFAAPAVGPFIDIDGLAKTICDAVQALNEDGSPVLASIKSNAAELKSRNSPLAVLKELGVPDLGEAKVRRIAAPRTVSASVSKVPNVLLVGRFGFTGGYGSIVKNYATALEDAGLNYVCFDHAKQEIVGPGRGDFWSYDSGTSTFLSGGYLATIMCEVPTEFDKIHVSGRNRLIGCTLFETHSFPAAWLSPLRLVDEIWVPTQFNLDTFEHAGVEPERLRKVPYCLDSNFYSAHQSRGHRAEGTHFLYVLSNLNRKDVGLLLRSYVEEFDADEPVELTLKIVSRSKELLNILEGYIGGRSFDDPTIPRINLIQGDLSNDQMRELYESCDVYCTTERAKGWDYPAMEALAMHRPVVAIDYSGSTEFLDDSNSYLIEPTGHLTMADPRLVSNLEIYLGHMYADVRSDAVRRALREAHEDVAGRPVKGEAGRDRVEKSFSCKAIGPIIESALKDHGVLAYRGVEAPTVRFDKIAARKNG